jgi:hypothetical protein
MVDLQNQLGTGVKLGHHPAPDAPNHTRQGFCCANEFPPVMAEAQRGLEGGRQRTSRGGASNPVRNSPARYDVTAWLTHARTRHVRAQIR